MDTAAPPLAIQDFRAKWRGAAPTERAAQSHFIDLCRALGVPAPTDADPTGAFHAFARDAEKTDGAGVLRLGRSPTTRGRPRQRSGTARVCGLSAAQSPPPSRCRSPLPFAPPRAAIRPPRPRCPFCPAGQAARLRELGCGQGQGFFFGRPQPAEGITALLEKVTFVVGQRPLRTG